MDKKIFLIFLIFASLISLSVCKKKSKRQDRFVPKLHTSKCVENICNGTANYPERYIANALAKDPRYSEFNGTAFQPFRDMKVVSRWQGNEDENMCATSQYFMFPTHARNVNLEWKFIVQVGDFKQAVHFEACSPKAKCFAESFVPLNYKTSCEQRKVAIKLLSISADGVVATDHFPVPGGCVCTYKFSSGSEESKRSR